MFVFSLLHTQVSLCCHFISSLFCFYHHTTSLPPQAKHFHLYLCCIQGLCIHKLKMQTKKESQHALLCRSPGCQLVEGKHNRWAKRISILGAAFVLFTECIHIQVHTFSCNILSFSYLFLPGTEAWNEQKWKTPSKKSSRSFTVRSLLESRTNETDIQGMKSRRG